MSSQTELIPISGCENPNRIGDLIFLPGLGGHPQETWHSQGKRDNNDFWPAWLGEGLPAVGVWSLKYEAKPFRWQGSTMSLVDLSSNVLHLLEAHGIGQRPIFWIAHSMGGLLLEQMLRRASDLGNPKWEPIAEQTKGIVSFGTPYNGSRLAAFIKNIGIIFPSLSVYELNANDPHLRDLNEWFRHYCLKKNMKITVYCEDKPTRGVMVVDKASADPGIAGVYPIPLPADHLEICRLKSREDYVYKNVKNLVSDCLENGQDTEQVTESNGEEYSNCSSTPKDQIPLKDTGAIITKNEPTIINTHGGNYIQNIYQTNITNVNKNYIANKTSKSLEFHRKILAVLFIFFVGHIALFTGSLVFLTIAYVNSRMDGISSQSQDNVFLPGIEEQNFNDIFTAFSTESNDFSINLGENSWVKLVILETNYLLINNHNQVVDDSLFPNYLMVYGFLTTSNSTFNSVTDNMGVLMKNVLSQGNTIDEVSLILGNFPNRHLQKLDFRLEGLRALDSFSEMSNSNKIFSAFPIGSNIPINPPMDNPGTLPGQETIGRPPGRKYMDKELQPPIIKDMSGVNLDKNCYTPPDPNTGQERKDGQENIDSIEHVKTKSVPEPSNVLALLFFLLFAVSKKNQK